MNIDYKRHAQQILQLIDLTLLNYDDSIQKIEVLCNKATTSFGNVAAICIYSQFVPHAKQILNGTTIKIATVTNFPHGNSDIDVALFETQLALDRGANEIDIVFPYHALVAGDHLIGAQIIKQAKTICNNKILKVIIESGALKTPELIKLASKISIDNGADFIKTSTGKTSINATIESAEIMLNEIKSSNPNCGFKASGGIKTVLDAIPYINLAQQIMGETWITPQNFRFGASSLLNDVCNILKNNNTSENFTNDY